MNGWKGYLLLVLILSVGLAGLAYSQSISEDDARQAFEQAGCTSCHNGGAAPDWDGIVQVIEEWAQNYNSLDEAVQNEYTFAGGADSYDEMMETMKQYTPGITDEQYQMLYQFFIQVFEEARSQAQTTTTTTQPPSTTTETTTAAGTGGVSTVTETVTVTKTKEKTETETVTELIKEKEEKQVIVTEEKTPAEEYMVPGAMKYAVVVAVVLAVIGLVYLYLNAIKK